MIYISPQEVLSIYQRREKELLRAQRSATIAWGVCLGGTCGVLVECFSMLNTTSTTLRSSLRLSGPRLDAGLITKSDSLKSS